MKKWMVGLLAALCVAAPAAAGGAQDAAFISVGGIVTEIRVDEASGISYIALETDDQSPVVLVVSPDTYRAGGEIAVDAAIAGWYDSQAPAPAIYPPQYGAIAVATGLPEGQFFIVDRFDAELVSSNGMLKLTLDDTVPVENRDGTVFDGELGGCVLAVYYGATTRSIPAQATPSRVVVLAPAETLSPELPELTDIAYVVAGTPIEAPAPFYGEANAVMVPLRQLADALHWDVQFDATTGKGSAGGATFEIGSRLYGTVDAAEAQLNAAPALEAGEVYVPLNFFRQAAGLNNAYLFEAQIVIDDEEAMG
ncbi:MAG: copper amine oxidase N-terminal domain-containing protein [Clostridiales bacterium]|nr:copper amine oxidase N-terminal domain-containing protein [Clostridiales bacterium]